MSPYQEPGIDPAAPAGTPPTVAAPVAPPPAPTAAPDGTAPVAGALPVAPVAPTTPVAPFAPEEVRATPPEVRAVAPVPVDTLNRPAPPPVTLPGSVELFPYGNGLPAQHLAAPEQGPGATTGESLPGTPADQAAQAEPTPPDQPGQQADVTKTAKDTAIQAAKNRVASAVVQQAKRAVGRAAVQAGIWIAANPVVAAIIGAATLLAIGITLFIIFYIIPNYTLGNLPGGIALGNWDGNSAMPAEFDPGYVMPDQVFTNADSMSVEQIQAFLEKKGGYIAKATPAELGDSRGRSAAQIIWDATHAPRIRLISTGGMSNYKLCNLRGGAVKLNPQVIIVKLQTEMGLITETSQNDFNNKAKRAIGNSSSYVGFTNQVEDAASRLYCNYLTAHTAHAFIKLNGRAKVAVFFPESELDRHPGYVGIEQSAQNNHPDNLNFEADIKDVTFQNRATVAFYRYTPWVAWGQYNVWKTMSDYFPQPKVQRQASRINGIAAIPELDMYEYGQCGAASTLMVALYYATDRGQNPKRYSEIPSSLRTYLDDFNATDKNATTTTATLRLKSSTNSSCVMASKIRGAGGASSWDWRNLSASNASIMFDAVHASLAAGDPVIFYAKPGLVSTKQQHIVVIVGYNDKDDTFIIHNPHPYFQGSGTELFDSKPTYTQANFIKYSGQSIYGHTFMMDTKYVAQAMRAARSKK